MLRINDSSPDISDEDLAKAIAESVTWVREVNTNKLKLLLSYNIYDVCL